jgi:lysylphosphatidylglycerol synthetase-like protein (DUF2156 family)
VRFMNAIKRYISRIGGNTPLLSAILTVFLGLINTISAIFPAFPARINTLDDYVSRHFIEHSRTLALLAGILLLIIAYGLKHKRKRVFQIAILLLAVECALDIFKGLDIEEAAITGVMLVWLVSNRKSFTVQGPPLSLIRTWHMLVVIVCAYYTYLMLGFYIMRSMIFPKPSFLNILTEPLFLAANVPHFHYLTAESRWFMHSEMFIGACLIAVAILQALRPFFPYIQFTHGDLAIAKSIIQRYATDSLSYFSLQNDRLFFFSRQKDAFIAYKIVHGIAVVGGDPVGNPDVIPSLVADFLAILDESCLNVCFVGAANTYIPLFSSHKLKALKIGEEAIIDIRSFDQANLAKKVRRAFRHCQEEGISIETCSCRDLPEQRYRELVNINKEWLVRQKRKEYGYSMALSRMPRKGWDNEYFFVMGVKDDKVLGYLGFVPIYQNGGWSLDIMRRTEDCPNGFTEFLIISSAEYFRQKQASSMSLNFAMFSDTKNTTNAASTVVQHIKAGLYDNLSSIYQLKSLYHFNSKFNPIWQDRYIIYRNRLSLPSVTLAIMECERLLPEILSLPSGWLLPSPRPGIS